MAAKKFRIQDKVVGTEMDLSLQGLVDIPLREMALYRRITSLDLSNNHIRLLPDDFPEAMSQLQRLDLSRNLLMKLPETLGQMAHIRHLDLYRNKIERLPMSISRMDKLRWLDVKENPLVEPLLKICGECLDTTECAACARNVVHFMRQVEQQCIVEKSNGQKNASSLGVTTTEWKENSVELFPIAGAKQKSKKKSHGRNSGELTHEDILKLEQINADNIVFEGTGREGKIMSDFEGLAVPKKWQEAISTKGKAKSDGSMIPRSRTGIHQGIKNSHLIGLTPPKSTWSWTTIFNWMIRVFLFLTIGTFAVSVITAMIVDYRVIQKEFVRWASRIFPSAFLNSIEKYQIYIQSFVSQFNIYFPMIPYIEPNIFWQAVGWVVGAFTSFVSIFT